MIYSDDDDMISMVNAMEKDPFLLAFYLVKFTKIVLWIVDRSIFQKLCISNKFSENKNHVF